MLQGEEGENARLAHRLLGQHLHSWHTERVTYLPNLLDKYDRREMDVTTPVQVPSDLSSQERLSYGLEEAAQIELSLRMEEANDAVQSLKDVSRVVSLLEFVTKKGRRNLDTATRSGAAILAARIKLAFWKEEYHHIRNAAIRLGMRAPASVLRHLTDADLFRPCITSPHEFGSGSALIGWIWTTPSGDMQSPCFKFELEGKMFLSSG